ncbi:MAG: metallophosphoesterase [Candidatus Nanoarchaeia archaeon]|nr:metallophosphoesterase [Candidatus Nanoarchaeia archaeon]MDD5741787.1 metallophosphoesterase [Candidatus Nanoarchaeia archaeon]
MKTNYGIISDIHRNPALVMLVLDVLKDARVDNLILLGDIGDNEQIVSSVLNKTKKLGLETYIIPGSHETIRSFYEPMNHFGNLSSHLIDCTKNQKIEKKGHDLVFLPGSDWLCGGEFKLLEDENIKSGFYGTQEGSRYVINMNDLRDLVTNPEKTIVVSHVPRKFEHQGDSVDNAYFAMQSDGSLVPGIYLENSIRHQTGFKDITEIHKFAKANGFTFRNEKRGNEFLRKLYNDIGISKVINGHFHESAGNVHDALGNKLKEKEMYDELFWNTSYIDAGKFGILTVNDNKVGYRNLKLEGSAG